MGDTVLPDQSSVEKWMSLPAELQTQTAPKTLILPHPRLQERAFVLIPMRDVAATWVHPILQKSVAQMAERLPPYLTQDVRVLPSA